MVGVVLIMIAIAVWEIPRLIKKNQKKELVYFLILWIAASGFSSMVVLDIVFFNPIELIIKYVSYLPYNHFLE